MLIRDLLLINGTFWLLVAIPIYHLTGSLSLIEEVTFRQKTLSAAAFASVGLICFFFAWRDHKKHSTKKTTLSTVPETFEGTVANKRDVDAWINQWKQDGTSHL
jgi:hypothetical protein